MAAILSISRRHLENLVKDRVVRAIKIGRSVRFRPSDVFRDLHACETYIRPPSPHRRRRRPRLLPPTPEEVEPPSNLEENDPQPLAAEGGSR